MQWHYRYTILVLCTCAFFVTYFGRLAISPVVPLITADLDISNTQIGVALTGMWLAYGFAQYPSGLLADRFGEKPIILAAVGGTTMMSLLLAFAPVYLAFGIFAVGLGVVAGLHYAVATTLLSRTFEEIGTVLGLHSMGGPIAGLIAPVAAAYVGVRYGWRPAIGITVLVGAPVFLLFLISVRPTPARAPHSSLRDGLEFGSLVELLSSPTIAFTLVIAMMGTFVAQGLLSFLPTFLVEFHGYTAALAGVLFSVFFVVRAIAQVLLGRISDSYGRDAAIALSMLSGGIGTVIVVLVPTLSVVVLATAFLGVGSSFFSALDPRFLDSLPEEEQGSGFGLVRTTYTVIGATGSVGVGVTADLFGWLVAFVSLGALFFLTSSLLGVNAVLGTDY